MGAARRALHGVPNRMSPDTIKGVAESVSYQVIVVQWILWSQPSAYPKPPPRCCRMWVAGAGRYIQCCRQHWGAPARRWRLQTLAPLRPMRRRSQPRNAATLGGGSGADTGVGRFQRRRQAALRNTCHVHSHEGLIVRRPVDVTLS